MTTSSPRTSTLYVQGIDPAHLARARASGSDGHGNRLRPFAASGDGEPLRCCLRHARAGERIVLMSYAPFEHPSVWREVGPVYVHAERCAGYRSGHLPAELSAGPRILRTYRADATMNYEHNTLVADESDLAPVVEHLLGQPDVAIVHVRTVVPQCFLYSVTSMVS